MRGSVRAVRRLLLLNALLASPLGPAGALDGFAGSAAELARDLRSVWAARVEPAPRASSFDLERLQRRWQEQRDLGLELRQVRAGTDRAAAEPPIAVAIPRTSAPSVRAPKGAPSYLGRPHAHADVRPPRRYLGQRLVVLQRQVAEIERRLAQGDTAAAARLLQTAETDLATIRRVFDRAPAGDPNLIALGARIDSLAGQLAGR